MYVEVEKMFSISLWKWEGRFPSVDWMEMIIMENNN